MNRNVNDRLYEGLMGLYWRGRDFSGPAMKRVLQPGVHLFIREQSTSGPPNLPLRRRLWLFRHGFLSRDDVLYDLNEESRHRYVSEYQRELTRPLNGRWKNALDNKLHFHRLLEPFDTHRPAVYAYLKRDRFIPVDSSDDAKPTVNDGTRVRDRLDRDGRLVVKPTYGTTGSHVLICSKLDDGYRVNEEEQTAAEFEERIAGLDEYLVCEFVEQAPYAADLYPDSTNTIRPLTMWDPETDEPFVTFAMQRIGTKQSAPVDNWSKGGLTAEVNLESGELSRAVRSPSAESLDWHETHPETGAQIAGVEIPGWPAIRDGILDIAANYPQIPYVGWDIVVTGKDEFTVIEANSCTDVDSLQVHGPLLDDPRARRFYEHHDIIPADGQ
jgi:hypothetical protein